MTDGQAPSTMRPALKVVSAKNKTTRGNPAPGSIPLGKASADYQRAASQRASLEGVAVIEDLASFMEWLRTWPGIVIGVNSARLCILRGLEVPGLRSITKIREAPRGETRGES